MDKILLTKKRNHDTVDYDRDKIVQAITAAGNATGEFDKTVAELLSEYVELRLLHALQTDGSQTPTVEQIQDTVEQVLMQSPYMETAKAYIVYRKDRAQARARSNEENANLMNSYISQLDWQVNENSNMAYSLQGLNNFIVGDVTKKYWLNQIYTERIRNAHENGDLHIHDLDLLAVYCVGWSLEDLLLKGFAGVPGKIECTPAKHFRTALGQAVNFFYTLQGEAAGAQAFSNFDTLLAPFIRYDGLEYDKVKQAMQEFVFNVNVPTRTGFQAPFTNITLDLNPPKALADQPVIIGGERHATDTYGDFQHEMNLLNTAFAEVMMEGDAKGRVHTFPIPTINVTEDFDWENPNLDKLWEMTGKYGTPYFANFVNSDMDPDDARSMCPLHPMTPVPVRVDGGDSPQVLTMEGVYALYEQGQPIETLHNGKWTKSTMTVTKSKGCVCLNVENNRSTTMDIRHEQPVKVAPGADIKIMQACDIKPGMLLPFSTGTKQYGADQVPELVEDGYNWFKVIHTESQKSCDLLVYCFVVDSDEHLFQLANGLVTHNCRLRIDNRQLEKRGGGLFGANPLTGCYDDKTEVLTDQGWKYFKDLNEAERVLTRDTETGIAEWHTPTEYFEYSYDGELIHFRNGKCLDLLVTLDHNMCIVDKSTSKEKIIKASEVREGDNIPKTVVFKNKGLTQSEMDFYKFTMLFVGDGSLRNKKNSTEVMLSGEKDRKVKLFDEVTSKLPYVFKRTQSSTKNLITYSKELESRLQRECYQEGAPFYRAQYKVLPKKIFEANPEQAKELLETLIATDGHVRKGKYKQMTFYTSSSALADDIQLLALIAGFSTSITKRKPRSSLPEIKGRVVNSTADAYVIYINKSKNFRLREENIHKRHYKGKVYCLTVKNHVFYVRRNGRPCWSGNSTGVVTINLPRIGYFSKTKEEFMTQLRDLAVTAKQSLEIKRTVIEHFMSKNLYPYSKFYLDAVKQRTGKYWTNHFSTIGILGMNEACVNFFGEDLGHPLCQGFAIEVMDNLRAWLVEFQEETGNMFNLEASPAEGATHRMALADKALNPEIKCANEADYQETGAAPYYTNSTHLPVNYTEDLFEALELQDELQTKYTGGTVVHMFLGESIDNPSTVRSLVKATAMNFKLPYFSITPTFSVCSTHGYLQGEQPRCPECGKATEVYSRVVGYLRPVSQWNNGKKAEFGDRNNLGLPGNPALPNTETIETKEVSAA